MRTKQKPYEMDTVVLHKPHYKEPEIGEMPVQVQDMEITLYKETRYSMIPKEILFSIVLN